MACASRGWAPHARITSRSENRQDPPTTRTARPKPRMTPVGPSSSPPKATIERPTAPRRTTFRTAFSIVGLFSVQAIKSASGSTGPGRGARGSQCGPNQGRCECSAAVILEEVPLDFRPRDEPELAARALMNGHDPLLRNSNFGESSNLRHMKYPWPSCARSMEIQVRPAFQPPGHGVRRPDEEQRCIGDSGTMFTSSPHHAHTHFTARWLGVNRERAERSRRGDHMMDSTTWRTEAWESLRVSPSRTHGFSPGVGAGNEGKSNPPHSF